MNASPPIPEKTPPPAARHNLPGEPVYFFGYQEELDSLMETMRAGGQPVILRGFGGTGKSTMALKLAHACLRAGLFRVVVWVDARLYQQSGDLSLDRVIDIITRQCSDTPTPSQFRDPEWKIREAQDLLSRQPALLIFDNFESVIESPGVKEIYAFINYVLAAGAGQGAYAARVVITTREVSAEMEELADAPRLLLLDGLDEKGARLLVERKLSDLGVRTRMSAENHRRLYRSTGGVPKLLVFATGQLRFFSIPEIIQMIQPGPGTQRSDDVFTLLFRRTWEKLDENEKALLLAMPFFVEHAPRDALVRAAGVDPRKCAAHLGALQKLSLLEVTVYEDRPEYTVHSLTQKVCEALQLEDPARAAAAQKRFVEVYLDFVRENFRDNRPAMDHEVPNLIAATRAALSLSEWELLIAFRDPLNDFLWFSGYWRERVESNLSILEACGRAGNRPLEARVLVEDLGFTYLRFEDLAAAESYVNRGLAIYQELGDQKGVAQAVRHLGKAALLKGEYEWYAEGCTFEDYFDEAARRYTESLRLCESLSRADPAEEIAVANLKLDFGRLYWLWGRKYQQGGQKENDPRWLACVLARYALSLEESRAAIALFQKHSVERGIAKGCGNLGNTLKQIALYRLEQHEPALEPLNEALRCFEESLRIAERINKTDEIAHAKWGLAEVYEIIAGLEPEKGGLLEVALEYAQASQALYTIMATPADIQETTALAARLAQKAARAQSAPGPVSPNPNRGALMLDPAMFSIVLQTLDFLMEEGHRLLDERRKQREEKAPQREAAAAPSTAPGKPAASEKPGPAPEAEKAVSLEQARAEVSRIDVKSPAFINYQTHLRELLELKDIHLQRYYILKKQVARAGLGEVSPARLMDLRDEERNLLEDMGSIRETLSLIYGQEIAVPGLNEELCLLGK